MRKGYSVSRDFSWIENYKLYLTGPCIGPENLFFFFVMNQKKKNRKRVQGSVLTATVFIDGASVISFYTGPSEQATKLEIRVDISRQWKMKIII